MLYLFNSFGESMIRRLLQEIARSLAARPRDLWLIYYNPVHADVVDRAGVLERVSTQKHLDQGDYVVYRYEGDPGPAATGGR